MADFKVTKIEGIQKTEVERPSQYILTYYRDAINEANEVVRIEHRTERITLEQLQAQLVVIQEKIDAIAAL